MILIVGSGLSGSVFAERLCSIGKDVIIIEKRDHIGGNCYDYIDSTTGIRLCKYGAHLFHTNYEDVWEYVNKFCNWIDYKHKVVSAVDGKYVPIPVNINTINMLCNENNENNENYINNETEQIEWLNKNRVKYDTINNSEEVAKSLIGELLYDKLIHNYTYKQWNKYPNELSPDVLRRIPINYGYNDGYFSDKYQALPENGYTYFFEKLLNNEISNNEISKGSNRGSIKVLLNTDYDEYIKGFNNVNEEFEYIIFTGPIDSYFKDMEKLEYRSIDFVNEIHKINEYPYTYQCNSVVNYPENNVGWTRIVEHKHFPNSNPLSNPLFTIITKEFTNDSGEPYYPVLNEKNIKLYNKYKELADNYEKKEGKNVYFLGRLATYKYFNMDQAIKNSLDFFYSKNW